MYAQIRKELEAVRLQLEGKKKGMVCERCGCSIAEEAKKASDGKMLCEKCYGAMQRGESVEDIEESGAKYKALVKQLKKGGAEDPAALAAWIGRKKLGKDEFQRRAAAGRK